MRQLGERRWDLLLVSGLIVFSLALMTLQVRHHGLTAPIERFVITIVGAPPVPHPRTHKRNPTAEFPSGINEKPLGRKSISQR